MYIAGSCIAVFLVAKIMQTERNAKEIGEYSPSEYSQELKKLKELSLRFAPLGVKAITFVGCGVRGEVKEIKVFFRFA
jgi:hypothetical protein